MKDTVSFFLRLSIPVCVILGVFVFGSADLGYFTNLSNLWIMGATVIYLAPAARTRRLWYLVLYVCTVSIFLTFLVFSTMLAPRMGAKFLRSPENILVHFVVPILSIIEWLCFVPPLEMRKWDFCWAALPPLLYIGYVGLRVSLGIPFGKKFDRVPYFFLDWEKLGPKVLLWCLLLTVFVLASGWLFLFLQKKIQKTE